MRKALSHWLASRYASGSAIRSPVESLAAWGVAALRRGLQPVLLWTVFVLPAAAASPFVYTANTGSHNISVVDDATKALVATIPLSNPAPRALAVDPAGSRVYVSNYQAGSVSVIDAATNAVIGNPIHVGAGPWGIAVQPDGSRVYVADSDGQSLSAINTSDNSVTSVPLPGLQPVAVAVHPAGTHVYVASANLPPVVTVISTATLTVTASIPVGTAPLKDIAVNPAGTTVYVATLGGVRAINVATSSVSTVTSSPANFVAVSPNGSRLYVASGTAYSVINTATNGLLAGPFVFSSVGGIGVNDAGTRVYVIKNDNSVSIRDALTNAEIKSVAVGVGPAGLGQFVGPSLPDLAITKTHAGDFAAGQSGATYTLTVSNGGAAAKSDGNAVTVADTPSEGMTVTAMSGIDWDCTTLPACTRSDELLPSQSYPEITVTVDIGYGAGSPLVNTAMVAIDRQTDGGGADNVALDSTVITGTMEFALASNFNPSASGQTVTFTATASIAGPTPTGTVDFLDGSTPICGSVSLAAGVAKCATAGLSDGDHSIVAVYNGDATYPGRASSPLVQSVAVAMASLTVTRSGSGTGSVTSATGEIDCGIDCSESYAAAHEVTLTASAAAGSQFMGWLGACKGVTSMCTLLVTGARSVEATFAPDYVQPIVDIDGDGVVDALTDGLLVVRYLSGVTGPALTESVLGDFPARSIPEAILAWLTDLRPALDIDLDGTIDPTTDGLILLRYLFGVRGAALTAGAAATGASRADIEGYLKSLLY